MIREGHSTQTKLRDVMDFVNWKLGISMCMCVLLLLLRAIVLSVFIPPLVTQFLK